MNDARRGLTIFDLRIQKNEFEFSRAAVKGRRELPLTNEGFDDFPSLLGGCKMLLHFEASFAAID